MPTDGSVNPADMDPTGGHPQTTAHVLLNLVPATTAETFSPPKVIVDVPLRGFDGNPAPLWSRTEVRLGSALPDTTDVTLISLDELQSEDAGDNVVDPVKTVTDVKFGPSAPTSVHVVGFRHNGIDAGPQDRVNFNLIDITTVPTSLTACSARFTGWCTKAPTSAVATKPDPNLTVPLFGRKGSSTGIHAAGALHIQRFLICDIDCEETKFVDADHLPAFDPAKPEESKSATFTRMFGIDVPADKGVFEMDSFSPTLNNGKDPDKVNEIGSIWFDTDGARVAIGGGEAQTINGDECTNIAGDASRIGIGSLAQRRNDSAFTFEAENRQLLFFPVTVRDEGGNDPDKCKPRRVDVMNPDAPASVGGVMHICTGQIVASTDHPRLSSLRQELRTDRTCQADDDDDE